MTPIGLAAVESAAMVKTIEQNFADWEGHVFGFGYGTGEPYTLAALKTFFETVGEGQEPDRAHCYDYRKLEDALTPTAAWLLINTLAGDRAQIIEYGSSPRFAWLTQEGKALKAFMASKTLDELVEICCGQPETYTRCAPDACNCGPNGYEQGRKCINPFWISR